jgi:calcineurin-like phosphoesterase family protein
LLGERRDNLNFYISDLHLGHDKALTYDDRPFCTVDEQDAVIIERWNDRVGDRDNVYILGDCLWNNNLLFTVIKELKGRKHLILGNHDRIIASFYDVFTDMNTLIKIKDTGRIVSLCHYPIAHWEGADRGWYHLYGHIHAGRDSRPFLEYKREMLKRDIPYECYNVGCMLPYMDYTPRTLDEIIDGGKEWERQQWKSYDNKS